MRIIAGRFKGLKLAPVGQGDAVQRLRPTSSRIRTSIFDMLVHGAGGDLVSGARVLDLFAGTGAMGIEALSRGAGNSVFVDNGKTALGILRANIELAGLAAEAELLQRDATQLGNCEGMPFNLVFLDPPYGRSLAERALQSARMGGWLAKGAVVIVEEATPLSFPPWLHQITVRRFRNAIVCILSVDP